jgi:hypothetical protein
MIHPYLSTEIYTLNDWVEELGLTSTRISSAVGSEEFFTALKLPRLPKNSSVALFPFSSYWIET